MKRLKLFLALSISTLLITGCVGKEPNEIAYVVALGIDNGENGEYKITIQYANPTKISGGGEEGGGKSDESGVENLVLEANDIFAAVGLADQLDSKTFSLSHTKIIVFSQEIAKEGIEDLAELFVRNEELRPDVYLAVSLNSANEYLEGLNPATEINPAKYYHMLFDENKLAGLPQGTAKNFYCGMETGDYDLLLPIARQAEKEEIESALFKGSTMVGLLGEKETELYKLLDRDKATGYLTLNDDENPGESITVKTNQKKPPKYDIDDKQKKITVNIYMDGDIYAVPYGYNIEGRLEEFEQKSSEKISGECEQFMKNVIQKYDSDIFRLNEHSKMKCLTNSDYEEYKKRTNYRDFDIEVKVEFDIRRTGLIIRED